MRSNLAQLVSVYGKALGCRVLRHWPVDDPTDVSIYLVSERFHISIPIITDADARDFLRVVAEETDARQLRRG